MELYRDAERFPRTLQGRTIAVRSAELAEQSLTMNAARWRASHGRLQRAHKGVYLLGSTPTDLLDQVRAALVVAPATAAIGYQTAAALWGFGVVESESVHLVIPAGALFPQRPGITVHRSHRQFEPAVACGVLCTRAARTAIDLARVLPRPQGLAVLDAALFCGVCTADHLAAEWPWHKGLRGSVRARSLVPLADGRAQCAQETQLRLILRDAGLDTFEPQVPIWDGGDWPRYVLDLADEQRRVAAEYDGSSHLDADRMRGDRLHHNYLEGLGWRMRYFTADDIYRRPAHIVRVLQTALRAVGPSG